MRKIIASALAAVLLALILSGCGENTQSPAYIHRKAVEAADTVTSAYMDVTLSFDGIVAQNGVDEAFLIDETALVEAGYDPLAANAKYQISVTGLSEQLAWEYETVMLKNRKDEAVAYVQYAGEQEWESLTPSVDITDPLHLDIIRQIEPKDAPEDAEEPDDRTVTLYGMLSGEDLRQVVVGTLNYNSNFMLSGIQWEEKTAKVMIVLDPEAYTPVKIDIDAASVANDIAEAIMGRLGIRMTLHHFTITFQYEDINRLKEVTIPGELVPTEPAEDLF